MEFIYLFLGLFTGFSLILAIGPQNIFVIEQGLKNNFIFTVCLICSVSDLLLIFLGIFLFHFFESFFSETLELILNILLILFLTNFIWSKWKEINLSLVLNTNTSYYSIKSIASKTLGFTFLNPHVYSDTVFFLGNFSRNFFISEKIYFGIGASISSFLFFFIIGYLSNYFSRYLKRSFVWKIINIFIIIFMILILLKVIKETFY